jgi:SAM-dependent methyltransferase
MQELSLQEFIEKQFLSIPLKPQNMTYYSVRTSIRDRVRAETRSFYGAVLDVGCGMMPYRSTILSVDAVTEYVGVDLENSLYSESVKPDLVWDGKTLPVKDNRFDCIMATEILEHLSSPDQFLREIYRVLKPNGIFFATVPFIWNLHELPHDEFRYTPISLERLLTAAGFSEVTIKPLGGWNMAMAQMTGLWLGFAPMNRLVRVLLKLVFFPFYVCLVKTDRLVDRFNGTDGSMFNGLSATATRSAE